jgi:hypothetical protein
MAFAVVSYEPGEVTIRVFVPLPIRRVLGIPRKETISLAAVTSVHIGRFRAEVRQEGDPRPLWVSPALARWLDATRASRSQGDEPA